MIKDFLSKINIIINKSDFNLFKYIFLSNENSLDLYIINNQNLIDYNVSHINIIHKLSYFDFNNLIDNISKQYEIHGFVGDKQSMYLGKKYSFNLNYSNKVYTICFTFQDLVSNDFSIKDIYWDIYSNKFVTSSKVNFLKEINIGYNEYFELTSEKMVENILNDFIKLIQLVRYNLKYQINSLDIIINSYIKRINDDKKLKKQIKNNYQDDEINNFTKILEIIKFIDADNNIPKWIEFIKTNTFFNKLINDIDFIDTFELNIDSFEKYILVIVLNKNKIINQNYFKYLNLYVCEKINYDGLPLKRTDSIGYNHFDSFYIDRLDDYKKIKLINMSSKIDKYCSIKNSDTLFIKTAVHIFCVMFFNDKSINYNIEYLKLAYIFKRYYYLNANMIKSIFSLFGEIQKYLLNVGKINSEYTVIKEYYFDMYKNQLLKDFEANKTLEIPLIKKNNELKIDSIDIVDFQDTFGLFYEFFIKNNFSFEGVNLENLNDIFESELSDIRSNKFISYKHTNKPNSNFDFLFDDLKNNSDSINFTDFLDFTDEINDEDKENNFNEEENIFKNSVSNDNNCNNNQSNYNVELEGDEIIEYDDNNYDISEMTGDEIEEYNSHLFKENDHVNNLIFKLKYKRYKGLYNKLKQVEQIINSETFDKSVLGDSKEITDKLIDKILKN